MKQQKDLEYIYVLSLHTQGTLLSRFTIHPYTVTANKVCIYNTSTRYTSSRPFHLVEHTIYQCSSDLQLRFLSLVLLVVALVPQLEPQSLLILILLVLLRFLDSLFR